METENQNDQKKKGFFKELLKFLFIAFLVVVPFRYFIAQPFIVNGASMEPTFHQGEYLIVDQLSYKTFKDPQRGEITIFRYPSDPSKFFIKRIIGLPGEIIRKQGLKITIVNDKFPDGFEIEEPYIEFQNEDSLEIKLKDDEYFVMGDNRASSSDSRVWGPLKREFVIGRPIIRLFPLSKMQIFPGNYN